MLPIPVARDRRVPAVAVGALALIAWLVLLVWERSEYAIFHDHGLVAHTGVDGAAAMVLFVAGWSVMVAAMMLPTTIPLVVMFSGMVRTRSTRRRLLVLLLGGYVAVWLGFGMLVYAALLGVRGLAQHVTWIDDDAWVLAAATFALAGAYQFSRLKYRCQKQCRSPRMFLVQRWRGGNEDRQALTIGVQHGVFCVGCCWTLMLVMFALGSFSIAWMLLVGAVMAAEKNFPFGRRLRTPLGAVLLAVALVVAGVGALREPAHQGGHDHHAAAATAISD